MLSKKKIIILLLLASVSIVITFLYVKVTRQIPITEVQIDKITASSTVEEVKIRPPFKEPRIPPLGFKEFRNVFYRFQVFYPDSLVVREEPVPVSGMRLFFTSSNTQKQFTVFIIPHGDSYITPFRFSEDLPSGIVADKIETQIQGAQGISFTSERKGIGKTREIWFISHGFLYEVSTPLEHEVWLTDILKTWEFLSLESEE